MITNSGKEILAKYLLGQAPSYATHISLGCGAKPNSTGDFSAKQAMDFEMIRVPVSSRGFVNEGGVSKIALAAEMPTEYRYEISEVGLWSAGSNSAVTNSDSRVLFTFDQSENWQFHRTDGDMSSGPIPEYFTALDGGDNTNNINLPYDAGDVVFGTTADNESLLSSIRKDRQEGSRFLNYTVLMRGDTSKITSGFVISDGSTGNSAHIHLDGRNFNLSKNSPNDQLKLALSIMPKEESNVTVPYRTRIVVEFLQSELNNTIGYAKFKHEVMDTDLAADNRYIVITKALKDLEMSSDFSWSDVRLTRIYVAVYKTSGDEAANTPSDEYYVCLDAMRFDNVMSANPLYVMTGYSVVNTPLSRPIIKIANTSNYIEFRFSLGVT
jgi:hypothetical protein